jgi:uncharacterized protein (TIGR02231 family)
MRLALPLAALLIGSAAHAEDILIRADIAAATVYLSGADVTRRGTVEVPQGAHRLLIAMPDAAQAERLVVSADGALTLGPAEPLSGHVIAEGVLDDAEQARARAAVAAAEAALQDAEDEVAAADGEIRALEAQMDYLAALTRGGPDGAAMPDDPAMVPRLLSTLGAETARVQSELRAARVARRALEETVTQADRSLRAARDALARLAPFGTAVDVLSVPVQADAAAEARLRVDYLSRGAGWAPSYELRLDSASGTLQVDRFVTVEAGGAARWHEVEMAFSTAEPTRRRAPSRLASTPARIAEPPVAEPRADGRAASLGRHPDADPPTPVMVPEPVEDRAAVRVDGLSLRYAYGRPVSIGATGTAVLPLDTLVLDTETEARAVPRLDDTAFLVATGSNDTGEPILPGRARFYRDGALVGDDRVPMIAAGAEAELAFGPLDHLRLVWIDRSLAEGDGGVFTGTSTQARRIAFGVENTADTAARVRLLHATPFAEQEDLDLDLSLSPAPSERDVDDRRGVHAWAFEVPAGGTELVEMAVTLDWPEDRRLLWRP